MSLINMTPPGTGTPAADEVTLEQLQAAVPAHLKTAVTPSLVDQVNKVVSDPIFAEQVRHNFISYTSVMKEGKFRMEDYLHAVVYVSYKLMGYTNQDAYEKTFPARMEQMILDGRTKKDISAYVAAYNKGKLVNLIYEQTMIPVWVMNQGLMQKAINVQAEIMMDEDVSPKVRSDAADSLMTHLKKPDVKEFQISMETKDNSGITDLKNAMREMAEAQREAIKSGVPVLDITAQRIIDVTPDGEGDGNGAG